MNIEKTQVILKKINRLSELINGIGEANSTEKDLLKAYVLDLYEAVTMVETELPNKINDAELKELIKLRKKQEKKIKKQLERKRLKVVMESESEDDFDDDLETKPLKVKLPKEKSPKAEVEEKSNSVSQEMIELFASKNNSELSDKLANMHIKDLTKVMGINEKILTVNDLFGGNQQEMENILVALNGLSDFDEAKSVLIRSVATKYDWTNVSKIGKAKNFIKLVKRKYV